MIEPSNLPHRAAQEGTTMKLYSLALCVSVFAITVAQAQPPAPSPEMQAAREAVRKSCANDSKTYCADKKGREAMMCLRANSDKLSSDCKDALAKMPRPNPPG
jgi:hypothetical protein